MIVIQPLVCGAYEENAYLVYEESRRDLLVIDPGDDLPALCRAIAQTGRTLTDILLTHGHFDHMLAAGPLKEKYGARVHVHPLDEPMLRSAEAAQMNAEACVLPFSPVGADALYPDGERFELSACGLTFQGMHTPGHTPGGVCLILPEAQAAFTGDTIFARGYGRYDFPGGDLHQLMKSLRAVLSLPRSLTVYSGHGEADTLARIAARWNVR
ncbi:MAG: MBL fold metallo-hydrolase [Clostridia bacterium]|nr:MBL fold metallo-hydrolase [Clostridia bacterium]